MKKVIKEFLMRFSGIIGLIIALLICALLGSCKTKYIPVESTHTEYLTIRDTVESHDTIREFSSIVIRELDSLSAQRYNIPYNPALKPILIDRSTETEKVFIFKEKGDSVSGSSDSRQEPIYIEKQLTKGQQFILDYFWVPLLVIILLIIHIRKLEKNYTRR